MPKNKVEPHFKEIACRDKPCEECPFTNKSLPGYFGPYSDIKELVAAGTHDNGYPCHTESQHGSLKLCAGAVAYMKNTSKRPSNIAIREAVEKIRLFEDLVFSTFAEMCAHHTFKHKRKG